MTMTKKGDHLQIDFTGTSPETAPRYNAHPQAVIGHLANYIYEYVFHDLPVSSATFQPIDFVFPRELDALARTRRGHVVLGDGGHRRDERDRQLHQPGALRDSTSGDRWRPPGQRRQRLGAGRLSASGARCSPT